MHIPVMKEEVLEALKVRAGGFYIDATFGAGGHSRAMLEKKAAVLAFDKDQKSIEFAKDMLKEFDSSFVIKNTSFAQIEEMWSQQAKPMKVDGIIIDLGFSSNQIDDPERGFSFSKDGELDMRYDLEQSFTAKKWINKASKEELANVFFEYGQERNSKAIAKAIVKQRKKNPIETTFDLVKIISEFNDYDHKHCATRIFQAIRIHVNDEFSSIHKILKSAKKLLKQNGRLAFLTFHSLEDKIIKNYFENQVSFILMPSQEEIEINKRSRSAKLRWMIKTEYDEEDDA